MKIPNWILKQLKKKSRIYILPTRMGGYFNGLLFLMFLLSVGYNNNLLLIFTLLLFGLNLIWLIQTHFHLYRLKLGTIVVDDGHVNEDVHIQINWNKIPQPPHEWKLSLENDQGFSLSVKSSTDNLHVGLGHFIFPYRGIWDFQHLKVKSTKPFGLYETWTYYKINCTAFAFPQRINDPSKLMRWHSFIEGENQSPFKGPHDVSNLAPYQGEASRKISWKHYARHGELLVKEGEELKKSIVHFQIPLEDDKKEQNLSNLATQMIICFRTDTAFTLEGPDFKTDAGTSQRHLSFCLRKLAIC
jgi:hypothetical protein